MANDRFQASVQYGDLTGTAAADRADGKSGPEDWLKKKGLMKGDEFVLGIELYSGENPGVHRDSITVHFLLVPGSFDSAEQMVAKRPAPSKLGVSPLICPLRSSWASSSASAFACRLAGC
ncbi:MAG TPA: hypothetical protein VJU82_18220 [Acidobacteriaceae bacterium]|nr:hypothetical protein [Acidobacteriaceae bacterium]